MHVVGDSCRGHARSRRAGARGLLGAVRCDTTALTVAVPRRPQQGPHAEIRRMIFGGCGLASRRHVGLFVAGDQRIEGCFMGAHIECLRSRVLFRTSHGHRRGAEVATDPRCWVVHVAEDERLHGTHHDTRRQQTSVDAVRAKMTLGHRVHVRVDVNGIVWTRLHACLASDAKIVCDVDDAVGSLEHRFHRADCHAGRVGAVVAAQHSKMPSHVGEFADFHRLDPRAEHAERNVVFGFTRRAAGVTADALGLVDDPGVVHGPDTGLETRECLGSG